MPGSFLLKYRSPQFFFQKQLKSNSILITLLLISIAIRAFLMALRVHPTTDEVWLYLYTKSSFRGIWFSSLSEWHAPFYFILTKAINLVFLQKLNIFSYRLLALLFGVLANIGIWYLASKVFNRRVGKIAFVLSLFLPAFIWPSIYARYYSFLILLTILALASFINFLQRRKIRYIIFSVFIFAIGINTHYYFSLLLISLSLYLVLVKKYRVLFGKWAGHTITVLLLLTPTIYYFLTLPKPNDIWLINHFLKIPLVIVTNVVSWEVLLFLFFWGNPLFYYPVIILLWIVSTVLFIYGLFKWKNKLWLLFLLVVLTPAIIAIFVSYTIKPFLALGSLQIFIPALLVVLAKGIDSDFKKTKIFSVIFVLTILINLFFLFLSSARYSRPRDDYAILINNFRNGDIVIHSNINSFMQSKYYLDNNVNFGITHTISASLQAERALAYQVVSKELLLNHKGRIWYFEPWFENREELQIIKQFFNDNFQTLLEEKYNVQSKNHPSYFNVYLYKAK